MSTSKEALLSRLLQPESAASSSGKSLIQVVGGDVDEVPKLPETTPTPAVANIETKSSVSEKRAQDDQPSILEMMMAAQREAKAEKDKDKALEETKASAKPLGGGFKKGFFGGGASSKPKTKLTSTTTPTPISSVSKPEVVEIKKTAATAAKSIPFVFEEVQKAMEEDTHPLLKQLQSNDWMTPDLVSNFQSNKIVSNGFKNPRCMAAMQLLQKNPKEAQAKLQNDPEVSLFLQEFSKLMAGHFEALGNSTSSSNNNSGQGNSGSASVSMGNARAPASTSSRVEELNDDGSVKISSDGAAGGAGAGIQEIGPLHAQVLQKKAQTSSAAAPTAAQTAEKSVAKSSSNSTNNSSSATNAKKSPESSNSVDEEERVKQILQDDELRTMLMDPDLQRILMECGDPAKFQQHMRNPETYRKIVKLQKAGLVGTAR